MEAAKRYFLAPLASFKLLAYLAKKDNVAPDHIKEHN